RRNPNSQQLRVLGYGRQLSHRGCRHPPLAIPHLIIRAAPGSTRVARASDRSDEGRRIVKMPSSRTAGRDEGSRVSAEVSLLRLRDLGMRMNERSVLATKLPNASESEDALSFRRSNDQIAGEMGRVHVVHGLLS